MYELNPKQQQTFNRVDAKAKSMGFICGQMSHFSVSSYHLPGHHKVYITCQCDSNTKNSRVLISISCILPTTGKYAKDEYQTYSIAEFEKLDASTLIEFSNHVQAKYEEIEMLEEKLKIIRKDLKNYIRENI